MKILALSDQVQPHIYSPEIRDHYGDVDMVIGCGDLPFYYLEFIVSILIHVPVVYVKGNHDDRAIYTSSGRIMEHAEGCLDIDGRIVMQSGLIMAGIEGAMRYKSIGGCMYTDREIALKLFKMVPRLLINQARYGRYLDVLVTHSPPFGIHDRSDLAHTGFKPFLPFMRIFRPRYLLHGHVHQYRNMAGNQTRYEDTFIINVYPNQVLEIPTIGK